MLNRQRLFARDFTGDFCWRLLKNLIKDSLPKIFYTIEFSERLFVEILSEILLEIFVNLHLRKKS